MALQALTLCFCTEPIYGWLLGSHICMQYLLQYILFPDEERLQAHWKLFYRGSRLVLDGGALHLVDGAVTDFATYLNGFSLSKWRLYTGLRHVTLRLRMRGSFILNAVGYRLNPVEPDRHELSSSRFDLPEAGDIAVSFPDDTDEQMLSFEILPLHGCTLYDGGFWGGFGEGALRDVTLCLATTTCRKEEFIKKNVAILKRELLCEGSDMREHFFVHVVDNGRTLSKEDIEGFHVSLHPNKNTGGSGGFARGMMESLHQTPEATHVLLMDDDVLVLPESIRRTYTLLRLLKPEWQGAFISGAMLEFGSMNMQYEDIGTVREHGEYRQARPRADQYLLENVLRTNMEIFSSEKMYAGWWYCCMPAAAIRRHGLPLPFFIKVDDVEYGLRIKPGFISMAGICVWHLSFESKYNAMMEVYQTNRNQLMAKAITGVPLGDVLWRIKRLFLEHLCRYEYGGAELILLAIEDYMKGPSFIEDDSGERLLKEYGLYNEKLKPITEFDFYTEMPLEHLKKEAAVGRIKGSIYAATMNFQRFCPRFMLKKPAGIIAFGWSYQPGRQFRCGRLLAVNPYARAAVLRVQDRRKCRELLRRFSKDMRLYKSCHREVERAYADRREWLTSEQFWKEYLGI